MLSPQDLSQKQILFIFAKARIESQLKFWNDNIRLYEDGKFVKQISCYRVMAVYIIGECSLTSFLIKKLRQFGISIFLLNRNFACYASISAVTEGNYLLREKQYLFNEQLAFSKNLIRNKTRNQHVLICKSATEAKIVDSEMSKKITQQKNIKSLLGLEGGAGKKYFKTVFKDFDWQGRKPRTKFNEINLILDIGYSMLFNFIDSMLSLYGFDNYKGIYHQQFYQRKSLSCDIIEPFRVIIDKQVIKSLNLKQFKLSDFKKEKNQFLLKTQYQAKYYTIFAQAILDNRLEIQKYVLSFYKYVMDPSNPMPVFRLKLRPA